mgnify:CR=1 FL=1
MKMADDADRAEELIENRIADGIEGCRRALGSLLPVGYCHNCGEAVAPRYLFCEGGECAADWELAQAARLRNGK